MQSLVTKIKKKMQFSFEFYAGLKKYDKLYHKNQTNKLLRLTKLVLSSLEFGSF